MSRKQIKLSVPPEFYEKLDKLAEEKDLPLATFVRKFLAAKLQLEDTTRAYDYEADEFERQIGIDNKQDEDLKRNNLTKQLGNKQNADELILLSDILNQTKTDENVEVAVDKEQASLREREDANQGENKEKDQPTQINITFNINR
jgi:predicted DNA-binding protein